MDLDFACVRSLDTVPLRVEAGLATLILQRKSAFDHEAVSNAFMAAPPRHPFFKYVIGQLSASAARSHVLDATGPRFLTRVYKQWMARGHAPGRAPGHASGLAAGAHSASAGGGGLLEGTAAPTKAAAGGGGGGKGGGVEYAVSMRFEPWALLHRVHSCRPQCKPDDAKCRAKPACIGPYNFAPCKKGAPAELDLCARTMPNISVTTFWTATWAQDHVDSKRNASAVRHSASRSSDATRSTPPHSGATSSSTEISPVDLGLDHASAHAHHHRAKAKTAQ